MNKKILCALLAALLLFSSSACTAEINIPETGYPTLPSLQTDKTPLQQLETAFAAAAADAHIYQYGTLTQIGEETAEDVQSQTVSDNRPFDRAALYAAVAEFPDNERFLTDFCNLPLLVIPSNAGTLRYQVEDLCWDDAQKLLYAQPRNSADAHARCTVTIDLDAQGRFSRLEVVFAADTAVTTLFLSVAFSDSP